MKSRESLMRLKSFALDEKRRRLARIEAMIADFERMSGDLDREIAAEEARSGIADPGHYAYPTYAKAALQRRDNLRRSADELKGQLEEARADVEIAFEDLKKLEILEERDRAAEKAEGLAREQAAMERAALSLSMASARLSA